MVKVEVFDPPMCCSTGVCGPAVNPELVRFAASLEWLRKRGASVERYSLSSQPAAFAANDSVRAALFAKKDACLPLVLVNGRIMWEGRYPPHEELIAVLTESEKNADAERSE